LRVTRQLDIDRAKGMAILLVVFGHLVARAPPAGVGWYDPLRIAVYLFHMPFFMFLSGWVAAGSRPVGWPELVRRRAARLLLPFSAFGLAVVCGKAAASGWVGVDNAPDGLLGGLRDLVWTTGDSPARSVWYLAALFVFSVATPPALAATGGRLAPVAAVAVALYALPAPERVYLDRVCTYYVFYVAGLAAASRASEWRAWTLRRRLPLAMGFAAAIAVCALWAEPRWGFSGWPYKAFLLACGLLSMPALHGWAASSRSAAMLRLGGWSFVIYLLNTAFIGAAKAALAPFVAWDGAAFLPFAVVLMLAGTLGPVGVKTLLLRRLPIVDRATG
jgi:fucose 4-O-acetylase-like acetyltransferase